MLTFYKHKCIIKNVETTQQYIKRCRIINIMKKVGENTNEKNDKKHKE